MQVRTTTVTDAGERWGRGTGYVAYNNLLAGSSVSFDTSSEASGFEGSNISTWFAADQKWKASSASSPQWVSADLGSAQGVRALALYGHNLGTISATVKLQYRDAGGATPWNTHADFTRSPTTDRALMVIIESAASHRYWRILIENGTAVPVIGVAFLGDVLALPDGPPDGFTPAPLWESDDILNAASEGGEFLGRSVRERGHRTTLDIRFAPPAWIRGAYEPFRQSARLRPFFYAWNYSTYPGEVALCYSADRDIPPPKYAHGGSLMEHTLNLVALL